MLKLYLFIYIYTYTVIHLQMFPSKTFSDTEKVICALIDNSVYTNHLQTKQQH